MTHPYISRRQPDIEYLDSDGNRRRCRFGADADLNQHNPARTPGTHPYAFDPYTVDGHAGPNSECNETFYSDHLQTQDCRRYEDCWRQVQATYPRVSLTTCVGAQAFLRLYTEDPELRVLRIIRYCDAGGFSIYRYDVHSPKVAAQRTTRTGTVR